MRQKIRLTFFFILALGALGACARQTPTVELLPTASHTPRVVTYLPTLTATPRESATPVQTAAPQPTVTITPSPTPLDDFSTARYINVSCTTAWTCLITLEFKKPVQGSYYALLDSNKEYKCEIVAKVPNRLYCSGRMAGIEKILPFQIFEKDGGRLVFDSQVRMPSAP